LNRILVILGSPNNNDGTLSRIALGRAEIALREYRRRRTSKVIVTGGYGTHFNTTDKPHYTYVTNYLLRRGVAGCDIIGRIESSNTIEDALFVRDLARRKFLKGFCIITSDFHVRRAMLVFRSVLSNTQLEFMCAPARVPDDQYTLLRKHEEVAILNIVRGGLELREGF
jgi:uncharacterized SAM-binding protein YcdF (DUF218 family)